MSGRRYLRAIQLSPLVAGIVLAATWFSVPGPLRGQMLSMAAAGVPVDDRVRPADRRTVASTWLEADAERTASRGWADVRFRDAAERTWLTLQARSDPAARSGRATSFIESEGSPAFDRMRAFLRAFPAARIDAYLVLQPRKPRRVLGGSIGVTQSVPPRPFELAWSLTVAKFAGRPFDPAEWRGFWGVPLPRAPNARADMHDPWLWTYSYVIGRRLRYYRADRNPQAGAIYRVFVYGVDDYWPSVDRKAVRGRLHAAVTWSNDEGVCDACHGKIARASEKKPVAAFLVGPVDPPALVQYTTRPREESSRIALQVVRWAMENTGTGCGRTPLRLRLPRDERWVSAVWFIPPDPKLYGQTMLFSATFPDDPHGAFKAWRASPSGRAEMATRLWLALQLPTLLAVAGTLLGVSLVASPLAFAADRRIVRREEAQQELARVQRDAHDRVYNRLTALSKRVDETAEAIAADNTARLGAVAEDIRATVADLQTILGDGAERDGSLDGPMLLGQLRAVAAAQAARHGVEVELQAPVPLPEMPARLGWDLQCVMEEAITNAVRHGKASHVSASLRPDARALHLEVSDDGLDPGAADASARPSTGLAGMRERVDVWGGVVEFATGETGARLTVEIPLPPALRWRR